MEQIIRIARGVWRDIRRGENIGFYLTVLAAITITVLKLLGSERAQQWVGPLTLGVLGLLATSLLATRHRLDKLLEMTLRRPGNSYLEDDDVRADIKSAFEEASELWLIGIHMSGTLSKYVPVLQKKLDQGAKIRIMIGDPSPQASCWRVAAKRYRPPRDANDLRAEIRTAVKRFYPLLETASAKQSKIRDRLVIKTIDYPLEYRAFMLDPHTDRSIIFVKRYAFQTEGEIEGPTPNMVYRPSDERWHQFMKSEIEAFWNAGEVVGLDRAKQILSQT